MIALGNTMQLPSSDSGNMNSTFRHLDVLTPSGEVTSSAGPAPDILCSEFLETQTMIDKARERDSLLHCTVSISDYCIDWQVDC
jgi:hypothetical protein